jgi:hypothetical protein
MRLSPGMGVGIACPRLSSFNLPTGQKRQSFSLGRILARHRSTGPLPGRPGLFFFEL